MHETHDLATTTRDHMSDADRVMDCLCSAKERAMTYARAALECTNPGVREFFLAMHGEESHSQEILFSFLHTRGFYPVEMAPAERIGEVRQHYQAIHDQLGLVGRPSLRRYQTADPKAHPAVSQHPEHFEQHGHH